MKIFIELADCIMCSKKALIGRTTELVNVPASLIFLSMGRSLNQHVDLPVTPFVGITVIMLRIFVLYQVKNNGLLLRA